jgi:hypothetical protein
MTQLGILFPKGADDHARFILPKEVERVLDHRGSTCTPPSISTGVKGEGWILVFHVLDIKGFLVEPVLAQPHLSPGSTQKSNELSTPAENLLLYSKVFIFDFPRYRPPFGECCVCSSISFPFRDTSCVCVGTCVRVCV